MNFLSYFIVLIMSFLGLFIGFILILIAPEEKKPGDKYFNMLQYIFLFLIAAFMLAYSAGLLFIILAAILLAGIMILKNKKTKLYLIPIILAFIFYTSSKNTELFLIISSLMLLFNMAVGSLITDYKKKKESFANILSYNASFIILGIILFFTSF